MGSELPCTMQFQGKVSMGKALLETKELIFRGDVRLKILLADVQKVVAKHGQLHVKTSDGTAIFGLGRKAEQWQEKILRPKSVAEKLGPKSGESVLILGPLPKEFVTELENREVKVMRGRLSSSIPWIFLAAETKADLGRLPAIRKAMGATAALWIVYPKGVKALTERDVRGAGLEAELVDVKVASFSETHTALKFVVPKNKR